MDFSTAYFYMFLTVLFVLTVLIIFGFIRVIKGPKIADRIVGINMISTIVIVIVAILSYLIGEEYLIDICIIYAAISFLAVVVLTKVYMGAHEELRRLRERKRNGMD